MEIVRSWIRHRYVSTAFDVAHITDNVIAMAYPSTSRQRLRKRMNSYEEVYRYLQTVHSNHYRVYNLSCRKYDPIRFHGEVRDYPCKPGHPPPLGVMVAFAEELISFLDQHPMNVAAVHCLDGVEHTGMMIAAYLVFRGLCSSPAEALKLFEERRKRGVFVPSYSRYLRHLVSLIDNAWHFKTELGLVLMSVVIHGAPLQGSFKPVLALTRGGKSIVFSEPEVVSFPGGAEGLLAQSYSFACPSVFLLQDVVIDCYNKDVRRRPIFRTCLNVSCLTDTHLVLDKHELDGPHRDMYDKTVSAEFYVELYFERPRKGKAIEVGTAGAPRAPARAIGVAARATKYRDNTCGTCGEEFRPGDMSFSSKRDGRHMHWDCIECSVCRQAMGGLDECVIRRGEPVCKSCTELVFPSCAGCDRAISVEAEGVRLDSAALVETTNPASVPSTVAAGRDRKFDRVLVWHKACFCCETCGLNLRETDYNFKPPSGLFCDDCLEMQGPSSAPAPGGWKTYRQRANTNCVAGNPMKRSHSADSLAFEIEMGGGTPPPPPPVDPIGLARERGFTASSLSNSLSSLQLKSRLGETATRQQRRLSQEQEERRLAVHRLLHQEKERQHSRGDSDYIALQREMGVKLADSDGDRSSSPVSSPLGRQSMSAPSTGGLCDATGSPIAAAKSVEPADAPSRLPTPSSYYDGTVTDGADVVRRPVRAVTVNSGRNSRVIERRSTDFSGPGLRRSGRRSSKIAPVGTLVSASPTQNHPRYFHLRKERTGSTRVLDPLLTSTAGRGLHISKVDTEAKFIIIARDKLCVPLSDELCSDMQWKIAYLSKEERRKIDMRQSVRYLGGGRFVVVYTPTVKGPYAIRVQTPTGEDILGSPFRMTCEGSADTCATCDKPIRHDSSSSVFLCGKRWHVGCFVCDQCNSDLPLSASRISTTTGKPTCVLCERSLMCGKCSLPFGSEKVVRVGNKRYHFNCWICLACCRPMGGKYLMVSGEPYHQQCFTCKMCEEELNPAEYYQSTAGPHYCRVCFPLVMRDEKFSTLDRQVI